jgi:hypothetical protein
MVLVLVRFALDMVSMIKESMLPNHHYLCVWAITIAPASSGSNDRNKIISMCVHFKSHQAYLEASIVLLPAQPER